MISLDSVKLSVNVEALKSLNLSKFNRNGSEFEGKLRTNCILHPKFRQLGISGIQVKESEFIVETSAKILKENYLKGLNINTVDQYLHEINQSGLIEVDPALFMKYAEPHKIDVTESLRLELNSVPKAITDISLFSTEKGYTPRRKDTGFIIEGEAKSNKFRLIAYDKGADLRRNIKANRDLFNTFSLKNYCKTLSEAQGIFRIEQNLWTLRDMRKSFQLRKNSPVYFEDILNSKVNVLYNTVCKVYDIGSINGNRLLEKKGEVLMELLDSNRSFAQIRKEYFMRDLIVLCKYDINLIMQIIRRKVKGDVSAYARDYRALIKVMQSEQLNNNFSSLIEVKELLSKVA